MNFSQQVVNFVLSVFLHLDNIYSMVKLPVQSYNGQIISFKPRWFNPC